MKNYLSELKQIIPYCLFLLSFNMACKPYAKQDFVAPTEENCTFSHLKIDGQICPFDQHTKTFMYPIKSAETELTFFVEWQGYAVRVFLNHEEVINHSDLNLSDIETNTLYQLEIVDCTGTIESYQLIFTNFPIIQINTNGILIQDEPKQAVELLLYDPYFTEHNLTEKVFKSIVGIETRGGSSQANAKRSYAIELWSNENGDSKIDFPLLGMRNDDDWILDALFIDKSKVRNRVSTDIWRDLYSLYYSDDEPDASAGTAAEHVEVFMDQRYHGLHNFTERLDRKLLQLKSSEPDEVEGLLYKAFWWGPIVAFLNYYPADPLSETWDGWEQKYPDAEDFISWAALDSLSNFVVNSNDQNFNTHIHEWLHIPNVIDYFILINLIRGDDNVAKNIYAVRYKKGEPFFFVPWDMDATWGRDYLGNPLDAEIILTNGLFDRLLENNPNNYRLQLKQRWFSLRNGLLNNPEIKAYFNKHFIQFENSGAFERETDRWGFEYDLTTEKDYLENWIDERLVFLDEYFESL